MEVNKIIQGNAKPILETLPSEIFNCCVTSPPYWGLRDYGIEPVIWDGVEGCEHEWGNNNITLKHKSGETNPGKEGWFKDRGASDDKGNCFCLKCGAWRGSLGLEPTFELYIKHLCDIFDQVKRVLRKDGTCFVNIGDSYGGSGNASGHKEDTRNLGYKTLEMGATLGNQRTTGQYAKSLLDIPYRFSIEMTNRGWIKRNTIIWHKPNCMPSSAKDRYTVDFEYVYFFTKSNKAIFWTNEKTLNCVGKQPEGTEGIEGIDWKWRPCPRCQGTSGETKIEKENAENIGSPRARYHRITEQENCKRCKGLGKVKNSFWTGHDYWFEQAFEAWKDTNPNDLKRANGNCPDYNGKWKDDQSNRSRVVGNPLQGRNKRAVWTISTKPFPEAHFAVYPEKLIEPMIQAGCPRYVCPKCGKAREKIMSRDTDILKVNRNKRDGDNDRAVGGVYQKFMEDNPIEFKGYTDCGCNAGFEGGIVLDPFSGAGTTAVVARKQGKNYLGIELKQEYIDMANKRIRKIPELLF